MPAPVLNYINARTTLDPTRLGAGYLLLQTLNAAIFVFAILFMNITIRPDNGWAIKDDAETYLLLCELILAVFAVGYADRLKGRSRSRQLWFFAPLALACLISIATVILVAASPPLAKSKSATPPAPSTPARAQPSFGEKFSEKR